MQKRRATSIVHIGFAKAASTWFQKSFYPHVQSPPYIDRKSVEAALIEINALAFDPEQALRSLGLAPGEAGILCHESLCGYLHNGGVNGIVTKELAHRIKAVLPDARIVMLIRSQPKALVAAYQQYVRAGGTYRPDRYFFPKKHLTGPEAVAYKQPRFDVDFLLYSRVIRLYDDLFGREKVHVFLFEDFQQDVRQFLRRFAARLDLEVAWDDVSLAPRRTSYGGPLTWIARRLNLLTARSVIDKRHLVDLPGWYRPRRKLLEALNRRGLFAGPLTLARLIGEEAARALEAHYAPDNAAIASQRRLPLRELGYPMPSE